MVDLFPIGGLFAAIAAVAPIEGVSVGNPDDKQTWRIDFAPEATADQREAAATALETFSGAGPVTLHDVEAERTRRLGLGFDFDFADERQVHHIGTTAADMIGWDDVTKWAIARSAGFGPASVTILTNTGPAVVTATDWFAIMGAATVFRQPIWAGSFWLASQNPIPPDYATNDAYWSAPS